MICKSRNAFHFLKAGAATTAILAAVALSPTVRAAEPGNWVPTWAASPQPVWEPDFFAGVGIPRSVRDQTVRQIGRVSIGGDRVRFIVSNEYGKEPLTIGAAHVALAGEGSATVPAIPPEVLGLTICPCMARLKASKQQLITAITARHVNKTCIGSRCFHERNRRGERLNR